MMGNGEAPGSASLAGKRIVITRSREQAEGMRSALLARGATPLLFPTVDFAPLFPPELDLAIAKLSGYSWLLFTSANAVRFFFQRLAQPGAPSALPPIAAIGSSTAAELDRFGAHASYVPARFEATALVGGLGDLRGCRILLPRSRIGREEIVDLLIARGAEVDEVAVYDTVLANPSLPVLADIRMGVDAVTFTSPSTLRHFLDLLARAGVDGRRLLRDGIVACIGPATAQTAAELGVPAQVVAAEHTVTGLVDALDRFFREEANDR